MTTINLDLLLEANRRLLDHLDQRAARVSERADKARAVLADCASEQKEIDAERSTLLDMEKIYRRSFFPQDADEAQSASSSLMTRSNYAMPMSTSAMTSRMATQRRARIGPQRYRILCHLRSMEQGDAVERVALATGLSIRRVKDQVRADSGDGLLSEIDGTIRLQPAGDVLLSRFEQYKRDKGEPLPSLDGPISDEDPEEAPSETDKEEV